MVRRVAEPLPALVRRFIAEHVDSVGLLEMLLLLRAAPDKSWTSAELARALVTNEELAEQQLRLLARHGLVTERDGVFDFAPGPHAEALEGLAEAYARRRHTVIGVIYGSDSHDASTLADAFRVRRRKR